MKIGIIVHSKTGNTYSVAEKLMEKLAAAGFDANLERVEAFDDSQKEVKKVQLKNKPDISSYDALIFGAPVRGGSLSAVMAAYLMQLSTLSNKKAACYVTEFFPLPSMGGNRAMGQMKNICASKDVEVLGTGIVNWSNIHRKEMIDNLVENFSGLFTPLFNCKEGSK
jgi:multimeric flavodoxin WrbA